MVFRYSSKSSNDIETLMKELAESMEELQRSYDEDCRKNNHGMFLEHIGFWNDKIRYRCRHCKALVSSPNHRMTI